MLLKTLLVAYLSLLFMHPSYGQNTPTDITAKFFAIYKTDSINKAMDYLFSTNKYSAGSQLDINTIKDNLNKTIPLIGHFTGYTLLTTKSVSSDMTLLIFMVKYERIPLFFKLLFYKPADKWQIQNFKFNSDINDELK